MTEVLLVEDDPAARQGLELALRRLGYGVRPAGTGEAALHAIAEGPADVVVLDVMHGRASSPATSRTSCGPRSPR